MALLIVPDGSFYPTMHSQEGDHLFHDPERNVHDAQLIFTTHDTTLLDSDLLRRDQIWFTEKDSHQASILFPLTEFTPRKNEAFRRGYLSGRYGAVPILKRMRA